MIEGHGKFFCFYPSIVSEQILPRMNIEISQSANKGAQFVPIGMPTDCWKTWSPKTTKCYL